MSFHQQLFNTVGSTNFQVPPGGYGVLVVLVGGAGQGGTGATGDDGIIDPPPGGNGRRIAWLNAVAKDPNLDRTAYLEAVNTPGSPEQFHAVPGSPGGFPSANTTFNSGAGLVTGTSASGLSPPGTLPSGGTYNNVYAGGLGGASGDVGAGRGRSGNLAVKIYLPGDLTPGANIPISIPAGGVGGGGGTGAGPGGPADPGFVQCYWTDPGTYQIFTASGTFPVPAYSTLTIFEFASGGGGGGTTGAGSAVDGGAASNSAFNTSVIAQGGVGGSATTPIPPLATGSGGDASVAGAGASSGGPNTYGSPGGFTYKTYAPGALTGSITVTIPNGGVGAAPGGGVNGINGTKGQTIVSYISLGAPKSQAFIIG